MQRTTPTLLRDLYPEDLLDLAPGGKPAHVGAPPGARYSIGEAPRSSRLGETGRGVVVSSSEVLRPGDIYFIPLSDVLAGTFFGGDRDQLDGIGQDLLKRTAEAVASSAVKFLGFIPLVYEAGPVQEDPMTAPTPPPRPAHSKLTFSGVFGDVAHPVEIWAWSLTFDHVDALGGTTAEAAAKARDLYARKIKGFMAKGVLLTRTRVALLQDGRHVTRLDDGQFDQGDDLTVVDGEDQQNPLLPIQTSLVVSYDGLRAGPTGKGRSYLPMVRAGLNNAFGLSPATALAFAVGVKAVAQGMSSGDGPKLGPHSVISGGGKKHSPSVTKITRYRAGLIPDTMSSRRNALDEAYQVAP